MEQSEDTKLLVTVERVEGKIDRMGDRIKLTEERVEALLDVVTGSKSGAKNSHVVRIMKLEAQVGRLETAIEDIGKINRRIDQIDDKLSTVLRMQTDHPPILYLLRFHTRKTVFWIVFIFLLLSLWYVSGFRQPILELLGLPVF